MNNQIYEKLIENLFDGIYYVNQDKVITFWNKSAERITGFNKNEVVSRCCSENILRHIDDTGKQLCIEGCPLDDTLKDGKVRAIDAYLHHKDGFRVPISIRVSPIYDDHQNILGAVEIFSDNSQRYEMLVEIEKLKQEVFTDSLTQIGNRKFGELNLETKFIEYAAHKISFGVLFLDIDHFKNFNDTYGHEIGDKVLIMVSKTITNILRKFDIFVRWGGEEFVVIIANCNKDFLSQIAERIRMFVQNSFIMHNDEKLEVTVSIGGTIINENDDIDTLIKRADTNMYKSKTTGRNRVTLD